MSKPSRQDEYFFLILMFLCLFIVADRAVPSIIRYAIMHKVETSVLFATCIAFFWSRISKLLNERSQSNEVETRLNRVPDSPHLYLGTDENSKSVYIPLNSRRMHSQVIGTTNAGKTESVIVPWAIDDIQNGRGLIIIDGKSDRSLLDKLYAYAVKHNRSKDFRVLSLSNIKISSSFNPLVGASADEITERIFAAFTFEDEYYKNIQFEVLKQVLHIFEKASVKPTFAKLIQAIGDPTYLETMLEKFKEPSLKNWYDRFLGLSKEEREKRTSGLLNQLGNFVSGDTGILFNDPEPQIDIENALKEGLIVYFQLPVLKAPTLGKATAKLVLQAIQSAVSSRQLQKNKDFPFFAVYLDDFTEYLTPSFVSLLNKSRSANVGVTFAHQAIGDLGVLGDEIKNTILTNANLKVLMRTNEPDSAEYFSKLLGTKTSVKVTERQTEGIMGSVKTGDGSVRAVEEFKYHPNIFKSELGVGEAVILVPFNDGTLSKRIRFEMMPDIEELKQIPSIAKQPVELLKRGKEAA